MTVFGFNDQAKPKRGAKLFLSVRKDFEELEKFAKIAGVIEGKVTFDILRCFGQFKAIAMECHGRKRLGKVTVAERLIACGTSGRSPLYLKNQDGRPISPRF